MCERALADCQYLRLVRVAGVGTDLDAAAAHLRQLSLDDPTGSNESELHGASFDGVVSRAYDSR